MSVVSNTGPLIALGKVDLLDILRTLFDQVYIPAVIQRELLAKPGYEVARLEQALASLITVKPLSDPKPEVLIATRYLDAGERGAIALAYEMNLPLMIDDRLGRQAAQRLNIPVTGVAGILVKAKQSGLIPFIRETLENIRSEGYWLSDELIDLAVRLADEQ